MNVDPLTFKYTNSKVNDKLSKSQFKFESNKIEDDLKKFFTNLNWTDRQILAMHFAERLSPWEIHVVLNLTMSDVLCRIHRLKQIARKSIDVSRTSHRTSFKFRH